MTVAWSPLMVVVAVGWLACSKRPTQPVALRSASMGVEVVVALPAEFGPPLRDDQPVDADALWWVVEGEHEREQRGGGRWFAMVGGSGDQREHEQPDRDGDRAQRHRGHDRQCARLLGRIVTAEWRSYSDLLCVTAKTLVRLSPPVPRRKPSAWTWS